MSWNKRRGRWAKRPHAPSSPSPPPPPLGDVIMTIKLEDLADDVSTNKDDAKITDVTTVASFSWMKGSEPAILIPGNPPRWTPLPGAATLQPDKGPVYHDTNASRYPLHPLEPAVIATLDVDPTLPGEVDIVCCGSTMGSLLRFVRRRELEAAMSRPGPKSPGSAEIKPFRILAEKVGDTVFFTRREKNPMLKIEPLFGFWYSFVEAYTTWDDGCEESTSNQRILRYGFAGMRIALWFEGDGYIPSGYGGTGGNKKGSDDDGVNLDEFTAVLGRASGTTGNTLTASTDTKEIKVTRTNVSLVPQSEIFELRTRSWRKKSVDVVGEEIQHLWMAQVSRFVLAFHENGRFSETDINVIDISARVRKWEEEHQKDLKQLGALLRKLIDIVKQLGKVEVCFDPQSTNELGEGKELLILRTMLKDAGTVLSEGTKGRWLRGLVSKVPGDQNQRFRDTLYGTHQSDVEQLGQDG